MDSTENESKSEAESLVEASASSNSRGFGAGLLSWIGGGGSSENTSNSAKNAAAPSITEEKGISESLSKLLTDKSYDKRKSGAVQVQLTMRRRWAAEKNHNLVRIVLDQLKHDFIESIYANHRKGGLISLAAISLALRESAPIFMEDIIPPVLLLLKDHDFSVRYYASEALFNIGTHIRSPILKYFNCIYDGICMVIHHFFLFNCGIVVLIFHFSFMLT